MGEYATYNGHDIKIGTCESMYYLRADQRHLIRGYSFDAETLAEIRFRFPFPDEDAIEPGGFDDHDRGVRIPGWDLPAETSEGHSSIQFKAEPGYLLSVPCPEGMAEDVRLFEIGEDGAKAEHALKFHRNGWHGGPVVRQLRYWDGYWATVVSCGSCGALWRLETLEQARPVIDVFRAEAERQEWVRVSTDWDAERGRWSDTCSGYEWQDVHGADQRAFLSTMADRIEAGYALAGAVV